MSKNVGFVQRLRNRREYGEANPWYKVDTRYVYEVEQETPSGYHVEYYVVTVYQHKYEDRKEYEKRKYKGDWMRHIARSAFFQPKDEFESGDELSLSSDRSWDDGTYFDLLDEEELP